MDVIKATVRQGRLDLEAPPDWPDGTEVMIEPTTAPSETIGIKESEWRGDPASPADWEAGLPVVEPLEFTPEGAEKMAEFDEQVSRANLEGVRRQLEQGTVE